MNLSKPHSNPIVDFCKALINSRAELLRRNVGNTTSPVLIKHEKLRKAFEYASSINTTDKGWANFLATHEADLKYIMLGYHSKQRKSLEDKFNKAYFYCLHIQNEVVTCGNDWREHTRGQTCGCGCKAKVWRKDQDRNI